MNKVERPKPPAGYDQDFARWSAEQAALLRGGRFEFVDLENVAEEIESLGRSDRREIASRLKVLLAHLLKWRFQPAQRKPGWRSTIREQRHRILALIDESPSLAYYPAEVAAKEYDFARDQAADETGLALDAFPSEMPYAMSDVLDPDFLPEPAAGHGH
jgi:ribosomal protein L29